MAVIIFVFAGFSSIAVQSLFLRELIVVFQGNELSLGMMLSHWLIGTALGNMLASKPGIRGSGLGWAYALSGAAAVATLLIARDVRGFLGIFPGEGVSLKTAFVSSMFMLVPLGALVGAQFTLGFKLLRERSLEAHPAFGYAAESAGCFAGGILFTFTALPFLNSPAIALALSVLFFAAAGLVSADSRRKVFFIASILTAFSMPWASGYLEKISMGRLFPGFSVRESVNSPYAQLTAAERNGEVYIFSDGIPLISLPHHDLERSEIFTHLPLLFHAAPEKVLVIGGAGKFVRGPLDQGAPEVDYAELDPMLMEMLQKYWPENFTDRRLLLHYADGRHFLARTGKKYDAILLGVPYPAALALNRYYTEEFFRLAAKKLTKKGILALALPGSLVYVSSAMGKLNAIVKTTIDEVFPYSMIIPGDENIIVASMSRLSQKPALKLRFPRIAGKTFFVSERFIDYAFSRQKSEWLRFHLDEYTEKAPVNRDFRPSALAASLVWWQSLFAPNSTSAYVFIIKHYWLLYAFPAAWFFLRRSRPAGTAFSSGFCAMGLQMAAIWGLQAASGNIYQLISALNASFMAGSSLGAAAALNGRIKQRMAVIKNPILASEALFLGWIVLWGALFLLPMPHPAVFFPLSAGTGLLLGLQFPLLALNRMPGEGGSSAGVIYAYDLLGGWLAAVVTGTVLIPAGGFPAAAAFLALMKAATASWWLKQRA